MKQYNIYIISLLIGLFFFSSCNDEELIKKTDVVGGIPVALSLNISSFAFDKVMTKADMGEVAENTVNDLHIFIFRDDKSLEDQADFLDLPQNASSGSIEWPKIVTSGHKYIVAIANVKSENMKDIDYSTVQDMNALNALIANLNGEMLQRPSTGGFVMSGYWGDNATNAVASKGYCTIPDPTTEGQKITLSTGKIWLRHLDSKIKFDVKLKGKEVNGKTKKEFIPRDWKVINVPNTSKLFVQDEDAAQSEGDFFDTKETKFEALNVDAQKYDGGSFTFYMLENRKEARELITKYAQREYKGPTDPFVNADSRSTYVVLRGTYYEYKDNGEIELSADVRYTIHLGYAKGSNEAAKAPDFDSERNYSYTYNVLINGVDDIILEVESSKEGEDFEENQPGAEGDVITSTQNLLLDAHYEIQTVTFSKKDLSNLSVMVRTPYEKTTSTTGIYKIDKGTGSVIVDGLKDFRWVEFVRNTSQNKTIYRDYTTSKTYTETNGFNSSDQNCLRDIKQLLNDLYNKKDDQTNDFWYGDGTVTYTVFINEFYYDKDPISNQAAEWRDFVNCDNRQMHILCNTEFSLDGQSSLTTSNIMISQRSIKTIYNKALSNSELSTAWGIETKCEHDRLSAKKGERTWVEGHRENGQWIEGYWKEDWLYKKETKTNGRYNTFSWLNDADEWEWTDYINSASNTIKSDVYAQYACLLRNRDLNGNGEIDPNEVRWYLPATNQYVGLWIGQDALPAEARLLQKSISGITDGSNSTTDNRAENHYLSSNGVRFWAEEGVATGSESDIKFYVRCARNLGFAHPEDEKAPEKATEGEATDYVKTTVADNIVTSVDLSRVDPAALRSGGNVFSSLDLHGEHTSGSLNYPYVNFVVNRSTTTANIEIKKEKGEITKIKFESNKCPTGYRIPNQREFALIAGYSPGNLSDLGCATYSELNYKTSIYRVAYNSSGQFNFLTLNGASASKVRCVKDGSVK